MISVIHGLCCFGYLWTFDRSSRTCIKNQTISSRKVSTLFMQYFLFPYSYNLFIDFSVSTVKILPRLVPYINKGEDALNLLEKAIVRLPSTRWLRGTLSSSCASLCSSPSTRNLSLFASASLRSARSFAQVSSAVFAWCCLLSLWLGTLQVRQFLSKANGDSIVYHLLWDVRRTQEKDILGGTRMTQLRLELCISAVQCYD